MVINELGLWARVNAGSDDVLHVELRTLPGRPAQRVAVHEQITELGTRLHMELPAWEIGIERWMTPHLVLKAPVTETTPVALRAELVEQVEALLDEDDWPVHSLSLVDWTLAPFIKTLDSTYNLSVDARQLQHERLSAARAPYMTAFCDGRWPVKYPDVFTEFYFELDVLEHELASGAIYQLSRTDKYPRPIQSYRQCSPEQIIQAGQRLAAKGWLLPSLNPTFGAGRYLRRGKSALLSKNTLL